MKIKIAGQIQEMAAEEILDHVPASVYKRIKAADPKAEFRAYCIGHEGESSGPVVGIGKVIKKWARSAVEHINDKLVLGTKIFHLHAPTNDHAGRKDIGEVVGKALSDIKGVLSAIAIAYIKPECRDIPLDVASIEADINMPDTINPRARAVDVDVEEITGIALGNSEIVKPGFAGATLQACVQEFIAASHENTPKEGEKPMTKDEVRQAIRDLKLRLLDVFSSDEIADDPTVLGVIRDKRKNEEGFETRMSEKFRLEKEKLEQEKTALQTKLDASSKVALGVKAQAAIKPAIDKRKLDEKQAAFIMKHADKFAPTTEEAMAGELDKFLDGKIDELKGYAEAFGIKTGDATGAGVGAGKTADNPVDDLLTPDNLRDEQKK